MILSFSVLDKKSQIQEEFMKLCKTLRYVLILKRDFFTSHFRLNPSITKTQSSDADNEETDHVPVES